MKTGGDKGGSPKTTEASPSRRRSGGANPPPPSPPRRWPPIMGIPGVSAFRPYNRPPPPPPPPPPSNPSWLSSRPTGGSLFGFSGGFGFQGLQAIPVGGGVGAGAASGVGGGNSPAARKRGREGGAGGGAVGGGVNHAAGGGNPVNCSVCGKEFMSPKALFGHMRSHPDRGWKGAHPPPSFRAEEEFADLRGVNLQPPAAGAAAAVVEDGGGDGGRAEAAEEQRVAEEDGGEPPKRNYRLPDLNDG